MIIKDTGGSAFPSYENGKHHDGMTLRDYFAAKAMQAIFTDPYAEEFYEEKIAEAAYQIADAMLAERDK
jgi:hypothetical protein